MNQKSNTKKIEKPVSKEELIKRLLEKAKLDFSCCGNSGRCNGTR